VYPNLQENAIPSFCEAAAGDDDEKLTWVVDGQTVERFSYLESRQKVPAKPIDGASTISA
jgi:hypothetical protein